MLGVAWQWCKNHHVGVVARANHNAAPPRPFVFVLDGYHLIHTLPIHEQLAFLLVHQPPQLHLVLATREDPPLPTWQGND
jgi:LuxR family maltose regulon positive regulatory protein